PKGQGSVLGVQQGCGEILCWMEAVSREGELRRERCVAGAELKGLGQYLVVNRLVTLPDQCSPLIKGHGRRRYRQHGQQGENGETAPLTTAAAGGGAVPRLQEGALGAGEGRGARLVGGPPCNGLLQCGELSAPVQERRVLPAVVPGGSGVGKLAVDDPAGLVLFQPPAQPGPFTEQDIMR